ncbi:septum formation family protein [Embleya sp. NPDC050493]|uniref:septum formation family protein n=1 Tax=Embleya sp. NPDC050493 TaxID=3363989 RepID=UPI00379684E0
MVAIVVVVALVIAGGVIALVLSLGGDDKKDDKAGPADTTAESTTSAPPTVPEPTTDSPEPPSTEPPSTEPPGTPVATNSNGSVAVKKVPLSPGDCIAFVTGSTDVNKVACTSPHDGQHVKNVALPDGTWPGDAEMDTKASAVCKPIAEPVIARQPQADELTWLYIYPKESGWSGGDREVQCLVSYTDETKKLTAPLK